MRSETPKVLHRIAGLPMAEHVVRAAAEIAPGQIILTIGPTSASLRDVISDVTFAWQAEPLGTGYRGSGRRGTRSQRSRDSKA